MRRVRIYWISLVFPDITVRVAVLAASLVVVAWLLGAVSAPANDTLGT